MTLGQNYKEQHLTDEQLEESINEISWGLRRHVRNKFWSDEAKDIAGWRAILHARERNLADRERAQHRCKKVLV